MEGVNTGIFLMGACLGNYSMIVGPEMFLGAIGPDRDPVTLIWFGMVVWG